MPSVNGELQQRLPVKNEGGTNNNTNNNNNNNNNSSLKDDEKQPQPQQQQQQQQQQPRRSSKKSSSANNNKPMVARALSTLNRKRRRFRTRLSGEKRRSTKGSAAAGSGSMEYADSQNSVGTFALFKYADRREQVAVGAGIVCMWYAASWQPISVFILATMASLMGQYAKKVSWIWQLNEPAGSLTPIVAVNHSHHDQLQLQQQQVAALNPHLSGPQNELPILLPGLYSLVTPLFDLSYSSHDGNSSEGRNDSQNMEAAIHDIETHEAMHFLRQSFAINGSAFLLALTQLSAFFAGMTLITWAAKKQASRVKILYFRSCLHQEVTWFEAIDSASGSGSSLNALVEKYEDGIGMKLALLCYFIGHVALFAVIAFYQMFSLAAFCMPFVLLVGLFIAYLSEWQAVAIGEHALFAKRSLQLAEEIIAAIRTVFAFNGQQKEITRYSISLQPVYRKSLVKHLYTALNTSLSKFSIFACFACYCFYAMRFFPPYESGTYLNKAVVLAVMRGAEVSIVNILISIPFMEALQQSKGSIARIYAAIERRSKINPESETGLMPKKFAPSLSFKMVQFGYAQRSGPTTGRRRSTLPLLNLPGSPGSATGCAAVNAAQSPGGEPNLGRRRQSLIDDLTDELEVQRAARGSPVASSGPGKGEPGKLDPGASPGGGRRGSGALKRIMGNEAMDRPQRGNKRILNYFNLDVKAGQSVALVGPSGSGKSTVLALVQRLYDVTGGQLLVGGHNVRELSVGWLRNQIGVVTQEPRLFDMSIADNIKLGLPTNGRTIRAASGEGGETSGVMQQVVEAARAAGAHEFISKLPGGYGTRVGSAGVQLSGGQKQRIAIARALIRKPRILLLDESTSALDTESEAQVQRALQLASEGRTTLTVAHRLATIKHAHLIVVMYQGQVVEQGSHEELMAQTDGIYRRMFEDQQAALEAAPKQPKRPEEPPVAKPAGTLAKPAEDTKRHPLSLQFEREGVADWDSDSIADWATDSDTDDYDDSSDFNSSDSGSRASGSGRERASAWQLWQFVEMPRWSSLAAALVCLLAGLILPMNLIAHSYLFRAFAFDELEQIGDYLHVFGLLVLSFSSFVFIVSFLQVILPGYVGEKLSSSLRVKTMDALLAKPMFYFDMETNSAGAICDRLNSYVSNIQSIAGTRVATVLEAAGTLSAATFFGFAQSLRLSLFCLSFALLVLLTTIVESRIMQRESNLQQRYDARLAHLMADALSNIKTIASLNQERFFIDRFSDIIRQREVGVGRCVGWLRTFLTSVKFVMPAMSWSASMYYACHLLVEHRVDVQTIFVVCPVVLFAVNDTFRALVFLPELLKARKSLERLFRMNREFSPQVLQTLTLGQQLEQQNQLHLEQLAAATLLQVEQRQQLQTGSALRSASIVGSPTDADAATDPNSGPAALSGKTKKSISFVIEPEVRVAPDLDFSDPDGDPMRASNLPNRRLSNINTLPSYMRRKSSRLNSLVPRQAARGRIEFRDVEFAYPNRPSALVLDGFSLSVAPGESVALVGGSGSGKSTCVAVLEKFYDYHGGKVTLDGKDLRLVESNWTRSQIGLVSQEPTLLSYTIGDNIRYGDNSRFVSMDEVVEAARTANIHDFIMSLPDQYDTELSTSAYSSSQLSGGQRQRIAIARALIRNAPILIFDEATSALDSRNESVVQDALNKARKGRTSLTIAHRLATIKEADKIAVLDRGRVVELGRHDELLRKPDGHYRRLWATQEGALCT